MSVLKSAINAVNLALAVAVGVLAGNIAVLIVEDSYAVFPVVIVPTPDAVVDPDEESTPAPAEIAAPPPPEPAPPPPDPGIPAGEIRWVGTRYLDVSAYNRWSDNKPGYRRNYANDDLLDLPLEERRLQEWHYTVALMLNMDEYHRALVRLPDGQVTHRYRFHIQGYNPEFQAISYRDTGLLQEFNGAYFSLPRDRMPSQWTDRIDILFTGCRSHADRECDGWGVRFMPIQIWEIGGPRQ